MVTKVNGTKGKNGKNGTTPTAGGAGGDATFTQNGQISSTPLTVQVNGGDGGLGGDNTSAPPGPGANGGNGGNANGTANGNIFNGTASGDFTVSLTATGGDGGLGGAGSTPGLQGNGGNATVTMNGNIVQQSGTMGNITLAGTAIGGAGNKYGNANASLNGNIIQPSKSASSVNLTAAAYSAGPDAFANNGNSSFGIKTATLTGNIVQGNVNTVTLAADTYNPATPFVGSNGTATITGNIVQTNATNTGTVTLEASGQHIDIEKNKITLGKQEFDLSIAEFGPTYDAKIKGNEFTGTGSNTFVFADNSYPGSPTTPDTITIDLSAQTFMFDGDNNKLKMFANATVVGNNSATITGNSAANTLIGGSGGNDLLTGGAGNDTIDGGAGLFDTAVYTGNFAQYTLNFPIGQADLHGTVTDTVAGRDGTDTLKNVEFLKFADGLYDVANHHLVTNNTPPVAVADSYTFTEDQMGLVPPLTGVLANDTDADHDPLTAIIVTNATHGTVALSANGAFTYTPDANYNGADSFTYKANDGTSDSNIATVNLTITPVNDAPVAVNDMFTTSEDNLLHGNVLTNDTDVDNDPLTAILVTNAAHGMVVLNANGSFTYTPNANYNGADSFTYKANDGTTNSNIATVNLTVTPVNDPPVAVNDAYTTAEDTALTVPLLTGVLANDTDVENDPLTATLVTNAAHGMVVLNANGSFTYTPNANYNGADSFTYKANDGTSDSNIATVNLTVTPVNDPPVAVNDMFTTAEDNALVGNVLTNDTDVDNDPLTAILVTNAAHGMVVLNANGSFTYTPNANYNGADSFTYKANDGTTNSNIATVNLTVTPVNDAPLGTANTITINEDGSHVFTAAEFGFTDPNDSPANGFLAVKITTLPAGGTLSVTGNPPLHAGDFVNVADITAGKLIFTPAANANGAGYGNFTFQVEDDGATGGLNVNLDPIAKNMTINVTPVNDAPVGTSNTITAHASGTYIFSAADFGFTDPVDAASNSGPNGFAAVKIDTLPVNGTLKNNGVNVTAGQTVDIADITAGHLTFTPAGHTDGSFLFQVQDNGGTANGGVNLDPNKATMTVHVDLFVGPGGFASINAAIAAANPGDTILIAPGTYNENVLVNKNGITLQGTGPGVVIEGTFTEDQTGTQPTGSLAAWLQTRPQGNGIGQGYSGASGTGITVSGNGVTLNNLTVDDFLTGVSVSGPAVSGLTLDGVTTQHSVDGFTKPDATALTGLTITNSTFTDEYRGASFFNDLGDGSGLDTTNTTITNSTFTNIDQKGVYMETAQGNTTLDGLTMNNVGQYGGVPTFGANGLHGNGIDLNLKYHTYTGNVDISGFNLTNVGTSNGQGVPTGTGNESGAIVVEGRDDPSGYTAVPANVSGLNVTIQDGTITGTSTGVRTGEIKAAATDNDTGPAVTVSNVTVTGETVSDIDNYTKSVMTVQGTAGADTYIASGSTTSTGSIHFLGMGGNDTFVGGSGDDQLTGGAGNDTLDGGANGAVGDKAYYTGNFAQYAVNFIHVGNLQGTVVDSVNGRDGSDSLTNIEYVVFADGTYDVVNNHFTPGGNTPPVASPDSYTIDVNTTLTVPPASGVLSNDTDADNNPLTSILVTNAANGAVTLNADGSFSYIPNAGYFGTDSFTYKANDGTADSNTVTVTLNVVTGQTLTGTPGNDTLTAGNGDDTLVATAGQDVLNGGGNFVAGDTADFTAFAGGVVVDLTNAGAQSLGGTDTVTLTNIENLLGGAGDDTLTGDANNNILNGAAGNDTLFYNGGQDTLIGGANTAAGDTANFTNYGFGVTVSTATGVAQPLNGTDSVTLSGVENLTGTAFADTLTGDSGNNVLMGGGGNDVLVASGGKDTLNGGAGTGDTADFSAATNGVTLSTGLSTFQDLGGFGQVKLVGVENIIGSVFNDVLTGDAGNNNLQGGAGDDTLFATTGKDTLNGDLGGNDTVDFSGLGAGVTISVGANGNQSIGGTDTVKLISIENLTGTAFADTLTGDNNNNILIGGAGNDALSGGGGTLDILYGGAGDDSLTGSGGTVTDVAYFAGLESGHTIGGGALGSNNVAVTVTVASAADGTDTLTRMDRLKFLSPSHVSDLDNNGFGDLIYQNTATGAVTYVAHPGTAAKTLVGTPADNSWQVIGTGQFTPDANGIGARKAGILLQTTNGDMEVITGITNTSSTTTLLSSASGTFSGYTAVTAGDFNGDASSDILLRNSAGAVEIAFLNGTKNAAVGTVDSIQSVTSPGGANWNVVASGDFDADGHSDILFRDTTSATNNIVVDLMRGNTIESSATLSPGANLQAVATGDFNGDGTSDILFQNTNDGSAAIWTMNGTTQTGAISGITSPGANFTAVGAEDVNGDGISDIIWHNALSGETQATLMLAGGVVGTTGQIGVTPPNTLHLIASTGGG